MMGRWTTAVMLGVMTVVGAAAAEGAVIDFSGVAPGQFTTLDVGAYRFTKGYDDLPGVFAYGTGQMALGDSDNGNFPGTGFTIARIDGALFTLDAVTVANGGGGFGTAGVANGSDYQVLYNYNDGDRVTFSQFADVASLELNSRNLGGATVGFRSLELSSAADAVPEPATWATMLAGFAMVGGALRRRGVTARGAVKGG